MVGDEAIREIIDRETRAWNTKDVPLLLSVFHPDMVWAWPKSYTSIDPVESSAGKVRCETLGRALRRLVPEADATPQSPRHREDRDLGAGRWCARSCRHRHALARGRDGRRRSLARAHLQALCACRRRMEDDGADWCVTVLTVLVSARWFASTSVDGTRLTARARSRTSHTSIRPNELHPASWV